MATGRDILGIGAIILLHCDNCQRKMVSVPIFLCISPSTISLISCNLFSVTASYLVTRAGWVLLALTSAHPSLKTILSPSIVMISTISSSGFFLSLSKIPYNLSTTLNFFSSGQSTLISGVEYILGILASNEETVVSGFTVLRLASISINLHEAYMASS